MKPEDIGKGKSIKEIADDIGVSKQAVFKKIKKEPLSTGLQGLMTTVDGKLMVSVDGERLIKQAFSDKNRQPVDDSPTTQQMERFTGDEDVLSVLKATIDSLQSQLNNKDEQILRLTTELEVERKHSRELSDKVVVLADQSQKLQLAQMQPQLTLKDESKEKQLEKSFWQRLFGKRMIKNDDEV